MTSPRRVVLDWAEQGHIAAADLLRALVVADVLPSRAAWRRFLDQLLLGMGVLLVAAGLIFFLAFNWNDMDRFTKFGLAEAMVVVALAFAWRSGVDRMSGKAALLGASLFTGALLALIGQTYQTGADSFELFGAWAVMILPWALVGRFSILWLLWLLVINLAIVMYFQAFPGDSFLFGADPALWTMFGVNTAALAVWEVAAMRGVVWLRPRWAPRLVATASGGVVTALLIAHIVDGQVGTIWATVAWAAWLAGAWVVYRRMVTDLFVLAGGVLSVILVVASFLANLFGGFESFLLVGFAVIALAAAGGMWLRHVAEEVDG